MKLMDIIGVQEYMIVLLVDTERAFTETAPGKETDRTVQIILVIRLLAPRCDLIVHVIDVKIIIRHRVFYDMFKVTTPVGEETGTPNVNTCMSRTMFLTLG